MCSAFGALPVIMPHARACAALSLQGVGDLTMLKTMCRPNACVQTFAVRAAEWAGPPVVAPKTNQ